MVTAEASAAAEAAETTGVAGCAAAAAAAKTTIASIAVIACSPAAAAEAAIAIYAEVAATAATAAAKATFVAVTAAAAAEAAIAVIAAAAAIAEDYNSAVGTWRSYTKIGTHKRIRYTSSRNGSIAQYAATALVDTTVAAETTAAAFVVKSVAAADCLITFERHIEQAQVYTAAQHTGSSIWVLFAFMHKNGAASTHTTAITIATFGVAIGEREVLQGNGAVLDPKDAIGAIAADGKVCGSRAFDGHVVGDHQKEPAVGGVYRYGDSTRHARRIYDMRIGNGSGVVGIGIVNGFAQRARAAVVGVADGKRSSIRGTETHA